MRVREQGVWYDIRFEFSGRTAIVTGAASGLGREIALELGASGALVIVSDLWDEACRPVVDEIVSAGGQAKAFAADVTDDLTSFLEQADPSAPWAGAKIFASRVRRNIKLAEAPSFGQSIFKYAPKCPGAQDYAALAAEVEAMPAAATLPPLKATVPMAAAPPVPPVETRRAA